MDSKIKEMLDSDELIGFLFAGVTKDGVQFIGEGEAPLLMIAEKILSYALTFVDEDKRKEIAKTLAEVAVKRTEEDESRSSSDEETDSEE